MDERGRQQLDALAEVGASLEGEGIDAWLFGGWAVEFYAGVVTRAHFDVDLMVWLADVPRIAELLRRAGWRHAPEEDEDGGTGYERDGVRLELTYLDREAGGPPFIPMRAGRALLPDDALGDDVRELEGVAVRVLSLDALRATKTGARGDDPEDAAKDRADLQTLAAVES